MRQQISKRVISLLLVICMLTSMFSVTAFAETADESNSETSIITLECAGEGEEVIVYNPEDGFWGNGTVEYTVKCDGTPVDAFEVVYDDTSTVGSLVITEDGKLSITFYESGQLPFTIKVGEVAAKFVLDPGPTGEQGGGSGEEGSTTPYLAYRWIGETELYTDINGYLHNTSPVEIIFVDENGGQTVVPPSSLYSTEPKVISVSECDVATDATEIGYNAVGAVKLCYEKDNEIYSFVVKCTLPDVGFYSSKTASEETFLTEFSVKDEANVFYLIPASGVTIDSVEWNELGTVADCVLEDDGSYATITVNGAYEAGRFYNIHSELVGSDPDHPWVSDCGITLKNGNPHLALRFLDEENGNFTVNTSHTPENSLNVSVDGGATVVFYYVDGETVVPVTALTSSNEKIVTISQAEEHQDATHINPVSPGQATLKYVVGDKTYEFPVNITESSGGEGGGPGEGDVTLDDGSQGLKYRLADIIEGENGNSHVENTNNPRKMSIIETVDNAFPVTFYYLDENGLEQKIENANAVSTDNTEIVQLTVNDSEPDIAHIQMKVVGTTNLSYKVGESVYTIPVTVTEFVDMSDPNSGNFGTPGGTWHYERNEDGGNKLTISHVENNTDIDGVLTSNAINGITTIEFTSGITGVTASFFSNCGNVTTFIFPDTVTRVVVPSGFDLNACTFEGFSEDEVQVEASGGPGAGGISLDMPDGGTAGSGSSFQLGADSTVTLTVYLDGQAITDYDFSIDTINLVTVEKNAEGKLVIQYVGDGITNITITASNGTTASYVCNTGNMGGGPGGPGEGDVTLDDGSQGLKYRLADIIEGENGNSHVENTNKPRKMSIIETVDNAFPVTFYYLDENGLEQKIDNAKVVSSDNTEIVQITVNDSEPNIAHVQLKTVGTTNLSYKVGESVYTIPVTVTEFVDMSDPNSGNFGTPGGTWHYERNEDSGNKLTISYVENNTDIDGVLPSSAINGITTIEFTSGITGITASFFSNCGNVKTFIFANTVCAVAVPSDFNLDACTFEGFDKANVTVEGMGGPGLLQGLMLNAPQNATLAYNFIPDGGEITIPVGFEFYISAFMDGAPITQYLGYTVEIDDESLLSAENKIGGGVYFTGLKVGDTQLVATDRKTGTTATFTVHVIAEPAASGSFIGLAGEIFWQRNNGVLTIIPNGSVTSVSSIPGVQFQDINEVVFAEGITEVRYGVFREINHATKFTFPSTICLVQMENGTVLDPYTFIGFDKNNVVFVNPDGTEGPPPVQIVDNNFFMLCDGYSVGEGEFFAGVVDYEMPILMYREEKFHTVASVTSSDETVVQVIATEAGWAIKPLKLGEATIKVTDAEGNTVTATCVIDGIVTQIGPESDIIDSLPEQMYANATAISLTPSATPVNVIDSIYKTEHEYFDVIKMKLVVPEDGVYRLSMDMDKYANTVTYTRTGMTDISFYNRITGGYNGTSSHMKTWEWYNLKQGEYEVVAVVPQRGVYFPNGVNVTFEKTAYPMAFQNVMLGFDGIVSGRVEGFYNPEDKTDDVVTTNGNVSINVSVEQGDHVIGASVSVAAATSNTLVEHEVASATLGTNVADVTFDQDALKKIFSCIEQAGGMDAQFNVTIDDNEKTKVVDLNLNVMQTEVLPVSTEAQNGIVTVTVPFVKLAPGETVIVNYVTESGPVPMEATYDAETQTVTFKTKHFSRYEIVHVEACLDGHTLTDIAEQKTGCTTGGCYAHQYCSVCQKCFVNGYEVAEETVKIPATHTLRTIVAKKATCTVSGNNQYYSCDVCFKVFKDADGKFETTAAKEVIPSLGHANEKITGKAATCTETGLTDGAKCTACREITKAQEIIPALGHKLKAIAEKAATYTATGTKAHWTCETCGKLFSDAAGKTEAKAADLVIAQLVKVESGTASVTQNAVNEAVKEAGTSENVSLPLTNADSNVTAAEIPVAAIKTVAKAEKALVIETKEAVVTLDAATLNTIVEAAGNTDKVTITVEKVEEKTLNEKQTEAVKDLEVSAVVSAEVLCNGENVHDFNGGVVTVQIPFTPAAGTEGSDYIILYVSDDGKIEYIYTTYADGKLAADLKHFSEYVIVKKSEMKFADVAVGDWYHGAIEFAYQNGLMNGVGDSKFDPSGTMTRAMLVTVLHRFDGEEKVGINKFKDVSDGTWYTDAVNWAAEKGIVLGKSASTFAPEDAVSREQIAAILYRYAKYLNLDVSARDSLEKFSDRGKVSDYAQDAIQWAVAEGIIKGVTETTINPGDAASRAEVATMLMRFIQNVVKK